MTARIAKRNERLTSYLVRVICIGRICALAHCPIAPQIAELDDYNLLASKRAILLGAVMPEPVTLKDLECGKHLVSGIDVKMLQTHSSFHLFQLWQSGLSSDGSVPPDVAFEFRDAVQRIQRARE